MTLAGAAEVPSSDAGDVLDARAIAAYRARVDELREQIADAEASSDSGRLQRAQDELDALAEQLAQGLGLGGRHRRAGSAGERARLAVTKAIRAALRKVEEADPELGRHLDRTVRTGMFCAYMPDPAADVVWTSDAAPPSTAPSAAQPQPHVGRPLERRLVGELVAAAAAGRGGVLLVSGEAGIGKTRLAEDAVEEARRRGMGTFIGRCIEGETSLPWLPLVEVLEQLIGRLDDASLRSLLGAGGSGVARLLPSLRRRLPDLAPPLDLPAEHARSILYAALRDLVLRLGSSTPAVVVLEDVHWADPATLSMLEHLAASLEDARILVLVTYRADGATVGTALARTVERLTRHRSCTTIFLRPLDATETGDLIAAVSGRMPRPRRPPGSGVTPTAIPSSCRSCSSTSEPSTACSTKMVCSAPIWVVSPWPSPTACGCSSAIACNGCRSLAGRSSTWRPSSVGTWTPTSSSPRPPRTRAPWSRPSRRPWRQGC